METLRKNIAENIVALRLAAQMTQAELAEKLNYTDKAVSKWERAESVPDVFTLKQLADLFGVSIDYLLQQHKQKASVLNKEYIRTNRILITLICVVGVFFLATVVFVVGNTWLPQLERFWLAYIWAMPVSLIITLVFNSIWGKKRFNFLIISGLSWSILGAVYLSFFAQNYWLLFFIGIPGQIIIILCSQMRKRK
jgi:transcriptional regulator with XRE-family HTH domain